MATSVSRGRREQWSLEKNRRSPLTRRGRILHSLRKELFATSTTSGDKKRGSITRKRYAVVNSFSGSPYGYGLADLNYYGSYINAGGCGQMWQPYFVGAGWSPYSAGLWAWYPGAGYSYVSMYPWGWSALPLRASGSYCQGSGWGWRSYWRLERHQQSAPASRHWSTRGNAGQAAHATSAPASASADDNARERQRSSSCLWRAANGRVPLQQQLSRARCPSRSFFAPE